eukprot:UN19022
MDYNNSTHVLLFIILYCAFWVLLQRILFKFSNQTYLCIASTCAALQTLIIVLISVGDFTDLWVYSNPAIHKLSSYERINLDHYPGFVLYLMSGLRNL